MSQDDKKLVGSSQVVEQEVAIEEDNAPSQGYPLSSIESRETTERSRMLTHVQATLFVDKIRDLDRRKRKRKREIDRKRERKREQKLI